MKVAVFVKASPSSEAGVMPSQQLLDDMARYNEQLFQAGIMKDGAGLHPSTKAVRVRFSGTERTVIDGPFAETKELVAGYWLWEAKSMDEAVPVPHPGLQPGFENKIMHCDFTIGSMTVLASDGRDESRCFSGFKLALKVATVVDAERVFNALAADGQAELPLTATFFSPCYVMVTDKFGVQWMVMVPGPNPA